MKTIDITNKKTQIKEVAPGIAYMRIIMVNVYFIFDPNQKERWLLVDAGMGNCAKKIKRAAEEYFGKGTKPLAIVLTHGHFDHVGGLPDLAFEWNVPVYSHLLEIPYLTGLSSYPPPDPGVGGGIMPLFSPLFSRSPIDLGNKVKAFRENDALPFFDEWKVIDTPGHSPGHVSFFRERDRALIAGDAFVTVKQESALAIMTQKQKVNGPPAYFTIDWYAAERSVKLLAGLNPSIAASGHGIPMSGKELKTQLEDLAEHFVAQAVPARGRYVSQPAIADERGILEVPPPTTGPYGKIIVSAAIIGLIGFALFKASTKKKPQWG